MQVCESCAPKKSEERKLHRSSLADAADACFLDDVIHPLSLPLVFVGQIDPPCPYVSSVFVFPSDVIYVSRGVVHPTDHYKIGVFANLADQRKREERLIWWGL